MDCANKDSALLRYASAKNVRHMAMNNCGIELVDQAIQSTATYRGICDQLSPRWSNAMNFDAVANLVAIVVAEGHYGHVVPFRKLRSVDPRNLLSASTIWRNRLNHDYNFRFSHRILVIRVMTYPESPEVVHVRDFLIIVGIGYDMEVTLASVLFQLDGP